MTPHIIAWAAICAGGCTTLLWLLRRADRRARALEEAVLERAIVRSTLRHPSTRAWLRAHPFARMDVGEPDWHCDCSLTDYSGVLHWQGHGCQPLRELVL